MDGLEKKKEKTIKHKFMVTRVVFGLMWVMEIFVFFEPRYKQFAVVPNGRLPRVRVRLTGTY